MKLGLSMDSKPSYTVNDMPAPQLERDGRRPKMVKRAVIGIVTLLVTSLVIGLSIYYGTRVARDTYKEAWQTFSQNGKKVEEKITVTEDSVDVKVPNEMEIIYDYKHGIAVRRFVDQKTKEAGGCYAYYINETQAATGDDVTDKDVEVAGDGEIVKEHYRATDRQVPSFMLSQKIKDMCKGTNVYWMEVEQEHDVEKRATCDVIEYKYVFFQSGCHLYLALYTLCFDASGNLLAYRIDYYLYANYFC